MSPARRSAAEDTEITLQESGRSGTPAMIPGSFETRVRHSHASPADGAPRVAPPAPLSTVLPRSMFERVWRYVMRPTDSPPI